MFLIWKHLLWETLFSSYQKVAFEKKKLKSFHEEAHRILPVGSLSLSLPCFCLMAPFSCFSPRHEFFHHSCQQPCFPFLLSLTSQRLHIICVSPQKTMTHSHSQRRVNRLLYQNLVSLLRTGSPNPTGCPVFCDIVCWLHMAINTLEMWNHIFKL